jgi:hypothetical protein
MTGRVVLLYQKPARIKPVYCGKCGAMNLEAFFSSQTLGLHLCPICAQSMIASGVAQELGSQAKSEAKQEKPEPH